jgi:MHS family proline/betaine transporter-like MFS transporter
MVVLLAMALNASSYLVSTYSNIQLTGTAGWTAKSASWLAAVVLLLALPGYLIGGRATDRFGARRVVVSGLAACCVLAFPLYLTLTNVHNPLLVGLIWLLYMLVVNTALSPAFAIYVSAFPGPVRYSGAAFAFSLGAIIGGGYTPYLASDLKSATGYVYIPAVLIVVAAIIGIATALLTRNVGERTADRLVR